MEEASAFDRELRDAVCQAGQHSRRLRDGEVLPGREILKFLHGPRGPLDAQRVHIGSVAKSEMRILSAAASPVACVDLTQLPECFATDGGMDAHLGANRRAV